MGVTANNHVPQEMLSWSLEQDQECDCHVCGVGVLVPTTDTLRQNYKGVTLEIRNFPWYQCNCCGDGIYDGSAIRLYFSQAQTHFEQTGDTVFNCQSIRKDE